MRPQVAASLQRRGLPRLVTNSTFRLAPDADLLYGADADWWRCNRDARDFAGIKVCGQDELLWPEVFNLKITGKDGFDPDPSCIRTGGNSGYQALHVAVQAGAARVLLFGFDMGGLHWHAEHAAPLRATPPENYPAWIKRFNGLAPTLRAMGVEVFNCTPGSALRCFPMATLESVDEHRHGHSTTV